jgi:hypothetical protein
MAYLQSTPSHRSNVGNRQKYNTLDRLKAFLSSYANAELLYSLEIKKIFLKSLHPCLFCRRGNILCSVNSIFEYKILLTTSQSSRQPGRMDIKNNQLLVNVLHL